MEEQKKAMEEQNNRITIDYVAHEADMARMERIIKRLWIALLVVILICTASNAAWIWRESQFEDVVTTETVTQESDAKDGGTAIVNNGGDVINGESSADSNKND